jgi:hypothetical protein
MEWCVRPMAKDDVFTDAELSRDVAIRRPSVKSGLNLITMGMPADAAVPRHVITF